MIYVDNSNNLHWTTNAQEIIFEACLQELRLWKGEKATDIEAGVDYKGVFDQTAFLKIELQNVCDKYAESFGAIEIGDPQMGKDEIIRISIRFVGLDGNVRVENLALKEVRQ